MHLISSGRVSKSKPKQESVAGRSKGRPALSFDTATLVLKCCASAIRVALRARGLMPHALDVSDVVVPAPVGAVEGLGRALRGLAQNLRGFLHGPGGSVLRRTQPPGDN